MKLREKDTGVIRRYDLKSPHIRILYYLLCLLCVGILLISIFPIVWVFLASFKDMKEFTRQPTLFPSTFDFSRFVETWNKLKFVRFYINSFISVAGSVVSAVVFNGLMAYGLSKIKPAGSKVVMWLIMVSLMIPATTSIVPLFVQINRVGLSSSFIPLWLSVGANAFFVILYKNFFDSLPHSLIEAARIDGCGELKIFFKIVLPLSAAINMVIIMYAINGAWSDFLLPYLLLNNTGKETVMVRLFQFRGSIATDVEVLRAIVFAIIPPIILYGFFQNKITQGIASTGIKG